MQSTSPQEVKEWPVVVDSGEPPISNFRKSKDFVPTGVLEHPKLNEICLLCILGHFFMVGSAKYRVGRRVDSI